MLIDLIGLSTWYFHIVGAMRQLDFCGGGSWLAGSIFQIVIDGYCWLIALEHGGNVMHDLTQHKNFLSVLHGFQNWQETFTKNTFQLKRLFLHQDNRQRNSSPPNPTLLHYLNDINVNICHENVKEKLDWNRVILFSLFWFLQRTKTNQINKQGRNVNIYVT